MTLKELYGKFKPIASFIKSPLKNTKYQAGIDRTQDRVQQNLKDLPKGVVTAVAAPFMTGEQLLKFNPKVLEQDYAKRIGGTFFDVATTPVGGAQIKSLKAGKVAKPLLKTIGTRAVEGAAFGGVRSASQGDRLKDIAKNTALGAAFGGAVGGLEVGVPASVKAVKETRAATKARPDFKPGFAPGFAKNPLADDVSKATPKEVSLPQSKSQKPSIETAQIPQDSFSTSAPSLDQKPTFYNSKRLKISPEARAAVDAEVTKLTPRAEAVVGKKLTNQEVVELAETGSKVIKKAVTKEETAQKIASNLRLRQKIAESAKTGTVDKDFVDLWLRDKAAGADIARQLQARRINADPRELGAIDAVLQSIYKVNKNADEIAAAASRVDFNNPEQLQQFYRQFVKPNAEDWLDDLRYSSMLSSPTTHFVNTASNFEGTGLLAPVEKTITGAIDALRSALTGTPRKAVAGEGIAYAKGYYSNVANASKKFRDVISGKSTSTMAELSNMPKTQAGTAGRKVESTLKFFPRLTQAIDEFFQALTEGGEKAALQLRETKGIKVPGLENQAYLNARRRLFNAEFGLDEDGAVLKAIEYLPSLILQSRNSDNPVIRTIGKYTFPFAKVPANIIKQGLEYSPFGVVTLPGAANKTEQLSKALIGTASALGVAQLLGQDRLTWGEPINAEQRNAFRAAGRQPYSIKIGDKWVNYSKLHPAFSFNFALVAAIDDAEKNKRLSEDQADTILNAFAKYGKFIADQSYLKNIGDFMASVKGDTEGLTRVISNYPQQLIPFRALLGWVERLTDPVQRQADPDGTILERQIQQIMAQIPGLAQQVPARTDEFGQPIPNQNRIINAFSPNRVTTEIPEGEQQYQMDLIDSAGRKELTDLNKLNKKGAKTSGSQATEGVRQLKDGRYAYQDETGRWTATDTAEKASLEKFKIDFNKSGESIAEHNGKVFLKKSDGDIQVLTKPQFESKLYTAQLSLYKRKGNYKAWNETAKQQENLLIGLLQDPALDPLTRIDFENDLEKLQGDMEKYAEYGGAFKKGSSRKAKIKKAYSVSKPNTGKFTFKASKAPTVRKPTSSRSNLFDTRGVSFSGTVKRPTTSVPRSGSNRPRIIGKPRNLV